MRRLIGLTTCLLSLAAVASATAPQALAGPSLSHAPVSPGVVLASYPNPGVAGEPALLAGRVVGVGAGDAPVTLFARVAGAARPTQLAQINADSSGAFVFTRAEAAVDQTATLYAAALGQRSHALRQQVAAAITLSTPSPVVLSGSQVALTGQVLPVGHAGEPVLLQQASASGWTTIARTTVAADGSFAVAPVLRGVHAVTLRALFAGDARNLPGASDPLDLLVQSAEGVGLSLAPSVNPVVLGQPVALSGTLAGSGSGGLLVTLLAGPDPADVAPVTTATADALGNFSFAVAPTANTVYRVHAAGQASSALVVGVQASVSLSASALSAPLAATSIVRGSVTGAAVGGGVSLQLLGEDGNFHTVAHGHLTAPATGSTAPGFSFAVTLTNPGSQAYRVLATGDSTHESSVSAPLVVEVTSRAASLVAAAVGQA